MAPDVAPKNPPARLEWLSRNLLTTNDGGKLDGGAGIASRDLERYAAISEAATNPPAVLESKADTQKPGQASPDDGDAPALTFAQPVAPAEVEEPDDEEEFGRYTGSSNSGSFLAIDPATGDIKWRFEMVRHPSGGAMATAGGLCSSATPRAN